MSTVDRRHWVTLTQEDSVDPRRRIIDAHLHLYDWYGLAEAASDARIGHNVADFVYIESMVHFRQSGPDALQPVGETEFVAAQARISATSDTRISAIVAFADLRLGDEVDEVLQAHERAGGGLFRGVRYGTSWDCDIAAFPNYRCVRPAMLTDEDFRRGVNRLGANGFSFDASVYHPQLVELVDLAHSVEGTTIALNHLGKPLNVGPYTNREAVRSDWRRGMRQLASLPNVVVKLGGVVMGFVFGAGWSSRERPPGSDEVVEWWKDDIGWCIDTFGPSRCMFASNYAIDRESLGYTVLWNAFQKIASVYADNEQNDLFSGTAARVYSI